MKTKLLDHTLWYDGYLEVDPKDILKYLKYDKICVTHLTDEIHKYNQFTENKIIIKDTLDNLDRSWNLPQKYRDIEIESYIMDRLVDRCGKLTDDEILIRYNRIKAELFIYNKLVLYDLLRAMIYLIDTFKEKSIVWGVGRGSSVSSYVLYLLEVHDIDSLLYELDFDDFLSL